MVPILLRQKIRDRKKYHMVNWPTYHLVTHKEAAGLGLFNSKIMNWCLMTKCAWKILSAQGRIWLEIFQDKYLPLGGLPKSVSTKKSQFSKVIIKLQHLPAMVPSSRWRMGGKPNFGGVEIGTF